MEQNVLKETLDRAVDGLGHSIASYPWEDRVAYANWLAQTYHYVCHSTRLLAAAAARMPFNTLGNQLHYRCARHMAEEKKHELLAVHDLQALDCAIENLPERPATRMFYEPQYTKIEHSDPITLFGYILVLEAMSAAHGPAHVGRVVAAHGKRAVSFLALHASEDAGHVAKALDSLKQVEQDKLQLVRDNIEQSAFAYVTLLNAIAPNSRPSRTFTPS